MAEWSLVYEGFDPDEEKLREALCTLGNGYFATRGAAEEAQADEVHYPGTYLAGGYNRVVSEIAGEVIESEDLVNFPNWLYLTFRLEEGEWLDLTKVELLDYRQELNLECGMLLRTFLFRDTRGRETAVSSRRIVHMADPHLAAIELRLTARNWSGRVCVRSALDGEVVNAGVERYRQLNGKHLEPLQSGRVGENGIYLIIQTNQSRLHVAEAARLQAFCDGRPVVVDRSTWAHSRLCSGHG